jgi:K+-transporting ATPase ATPase A chain
MLVFVILAVFIAGLMVGRTPEYLGKKIESYDVKMAMLSVLIFCLVILTFTAVSVVSSVAKSSISNAGPHGLTQILYAYVRRTTDRLQQTHEILVRPAQGFNRD